MADADPNKPPRKRGTTRRNFLIGTGATAGLVVGYALWPRRQRLNWAAGPDENLINGWVKIGTDGHVIVAVPQAEMGQGVFTALPQILADELGADWATVGVEPAPLNPIYANRGMAIDMTAEFPAFARSVARWGLGELASLYNMQMTGGSSSVRSYQDTIRLAGAAAREMLCKAAAREWGADWKDLDTANGFVIYKANRIRFADIAGKAAVEDAPSNPKLRESAKNRLMGKSVARLDIPAKTDGSARFGIDVRIPGLVYAAVRSGPVGDPALVSVDPAPAKAQTGIIDVVKGPTWVAIVAPSWWQANRALDALAPRFAAQTRPAGPWVHDALRTALTDGNTAEVQKHGDAGTLLAGSDVVQAEYSVPFLAHAALEPMNATVRINTAADGSVTAEVWAPVQGLTVATWAVAKVLELPDAAVTVYPTLLGGGFGRKIEVDAVVQAALIAKAVKRPVQLIWSREEDLGQDKFRPAAAARYRAKLVADNKVAAWSGRVAVPDVGNSVMGRILPAMASDHPKPGGTAIEGAHDLPYDLGVVLVEHALVDVPVPLGFWRSVGHSFTGFFVESFIDELAHAAGADPGAFRLSLLANSPRHAAVLRAVLSMAGPLGKVVSGQAGVSQGRGVALHESFGSIVAQVAEVTVTHGGLKITRIACAIDCGPVVNPGIVVAQVESAIIFGMAAATTGAITFTNGVADQRNFDGYMLPGIADIPVIDVQIVSAGNVMGGVGEPGTPPVAPAIANAIFAATGKRIRNLPFAGQI